MSTTEKQNPTETITDAEAHWAGAEETVRDVQARYPEFSDESIPELTQLFTWTDRIQGHAIVPTIRDQSYLTNTQSGYGSGEWIQIDNQEIFNLEDMQ